MLWIIQSSFLTLEEPCFSSCFSAWVLFLHLSFQKNIGCLEKECEHRTECKGTRWQQPRAAPFCHWTMVREKLPLNNVWCFDTVCRNYSNNLECKSTTGKLSSNCHRYLRRQRLFQNTNMKCCSCCSTGKLKGYFERFMRIQKKLLVKVEKDFPACLPGMCPV